MSSSHLAVAEECTDSPANKTCGRGEFGYGGGELPFSAVALNSNDTAANGESFACPSSSNGTGPGAVVSTTQTGTTGGITPPETLLFPGNLQGGNQGKGDNFTGDTQCYSPYVQGSSQATGAPAQGSAYEAAVAPINGGRNATWFVPNTSGSATNCKGLVLEAGGDVGTASGSAASLYNPNANSANFNTWSSIPTPPSGYQASMVTARDTPAEVQLDSVPNAPAGDTQLLLIGGEALVTAGQYNVLNSYEIFDASRCGFLSTPTPNPMSSVRYDFGAAKFASGDVLVCGGADDVFFDLSNTCDLFVPNFTLSGGGTWYDGVATMSRVRAGSFAALVPPSIVTSQATPSSSILMAGGSSSGGPSGTFAPDPTSDICTENTQSTVSGHFAVSCSVDSASYDRNSSHLGFLPQTSIGAEDASHVTIGCNPAEGLVGTSSPNTSPQCNGVAKLAGETSDSSYDGLILACGGLAGDANLSGGNDTQIGCEYYVPSGRSVPSGLSCNPSGATSGPAWCVKPGLHMNRERAFFGLSEVPARCGSTADSFWALGGVYGVPDATSLSSLTRKNVEWLAKGDATATCTFSQCPPACTTPVAAGENHSLAVLGDGTVWAWGSDNRGQLGDGTNTDSGTGVRASSSTGMSGVVSVATGAAHSLALDGGGNAWAWGADDSGQLGDGGMTDRNTPEKIMSGVYEVAAGSAHSLALANNGTVWSWGANYSGQLGNGGTTGGLAPLQVPGLPSIVAIAAGWDHSLALDTAGNVWAWGGNYFGAVGDGTTTNRLTPAIVLSGALSIAAGYFHSIAAMQDGTVRTWGWNQFGQLGTGGTASSATPVAVCAAGAAFPCSNHLTGISSVAGGYGHTLALRSTDGTVWDWGDNDHYQLGNNATTNSSTPAQVWNSTSGSFLTGVTAVSAGEYQSTALTSAGSEWEWGQHPDPGFCAVATQYPQTPTKTSTGAIAVAIAVAETKTVIVLTVFSPYTTTQAWDPRCQLAVPSERRVDIDKGAQTSASVYASYTDVSGKAAPLRWGYDFPTVNNGFGYYHIDGKHGFDAAVQSQLGTTLASPTATATDPNSTQSNPRTDFYFYYTDTTSNAQCTRKAIVDYGPSNSVPANPMGVVTSYAYVGWHNG